MDEEHRGIICSYDPEIGYHPVRAHPTDAGFDVRASADGVIPAGGSAVVATGLSIALPIGYFAQFAPRSGLAFKSDIIPVAGVIDSSYRGELFTKLFNFGNKDYGLKRGDKIAQLLVLQTHSQMGFVHVGPSLPDDLMDTDRGTAGFGSTDSTNDTTGDTTTCNALKRKREADFVPIPSAQSADLFSGRAVLQAP